MSIGLELQSHDHGNNNMEDSPHFSESESDKKQLGLDVSIKDEINIEPEIEGNSPEYVDVSVNSEERDLHKQELVCDLPFIKEELECVCGRGGGVRFQRGLLANQRL
uniref:Uncharacterized protein n=1 Tax=Timema douglasi TaxID=61478 RepID=A0A7R8ZCD8_TIMDO|nr:unnamed protein product [Timema douglasi]